MKSEETELPRRSGSAYIGLEKMVLRKEDRVRRMWEGAEKESRTLEGNLRWCCLLPCTPMQLLYLEGKERWGTYLLPIQSSKGHALQSLHDELTSKLGQDATRGVHPAMDLMD